MPLRCLLSFYNITFYTSTFFNSDNQPSTSRKPSRRGQGLNSDSAASSRSGAGWHPQPRDTSVGTIPHPRENRKFPSAGLAFSPLLHRFAVFWSREVRFPDFENRHSQIEGCHVNGGFGRTPGGIAKCTPIGFPSWSVASHIAKLFILFARNRLCKPIRRNVGQSYAVYESFVGHRTHTD